MGYSFTQEQIDAAYTAAPEQVREALETDPYLDFALGLQTNYKLHVDIAGSITELTKYLLLGLINPSDFVTGLGALAIPKPTVTQLVTELNEKVFKPLQEQIREGSNETSETQSVSSPVPSSVPAPAPAPQPTPAAPQIASVVTPPVQIQKEVRPAPAPTPIRPRPAPYTPSTPPSSPEAHREELKKIVKEYGADPYREPIQ